MGLGKVKSLFGAEIRVEGQGVLSDLRRQLPSSEAEAGSKEDSAGKWIASGWCLAGVPHARGPACLGRQSSRSRGPRWE